MKSKSNKILSLLMMILALAGCSHEPKVIAPTNNVSDAEDKASVFSQEHPSVVPDGRQAELAADVHKVTVEEVLPTVRYVYLRVREEEEEYWIATIKREVVIGATYFYQGGLLKTNFESREHNRVFEKMYLVSSIIEVDHSAHAAKQETATQASTVVKDNVPAGTTKIADLVAEPHKYEGKIIQVSGECVKVNSNIMGRNWVHIRDRSKNDFDLVITCDVEIPVGHQVTMTGRVVLNKDFGSGYVYPVLLEDGKFVR